MKTKQVSLTATNKQGAKVFFTGTSKADALRNFRFEYATDGWCITYQNEYGEYL